MNAHLIFKSVPGINSVVAIFFSAITLFGFEVQAQNHEWVGVFSGASSVQGNAVVTDASGNVYTTGVFQGTADFDPGAGETLLTSAGNTDIFITMLNASGELQWARKVGGTSADEGLAIRLDASGNVLISGRFLGTVDFDPGASTANLTASSTDIFVLKLNSSGNYVWAKRWGSNLASGHIGLAVDASDNVYTGGSFVNILDLDPGAGVMNVNSGASNTTHTFLVKLDASGNYVTGKRLGTPSFASVNSSVFETDASFNVFIAGYYDTSNASFVDFDPDAGVANLSTTSGFFVAKYNSSLAYVSVAEAPPVSMTDLHLDASGNILGTGTFAGTKDFDPGIGETSLVSSGSQDAYAFKLNSSYQLQWAKNFGGTVDDQGFTITTDGTGNVYVGGHFFGTSMMDFDPGIGTVTLPFGPNGYDGFILKLNASGEYQWAQSIYGASVNGWDKVNGVFVDGSNKVYSTGFFTAGTVDFNPGPATDNKTATNSDAFVLKWNQSALSAQTITFNPLAAKVFGDAPFALTATASSGLTVSYASSNTAVATVSGATVTILGAGSTTITASQAGNANYNAATSVPQTLTVNKASQTITFAALPAKTFGDAPFALGATASSGLTVSYASSNTAVATVSGNTVTIVGAGSTTITASQAGNASYNAATNVPQTLTVNKANQTITFAALPAKTFGDAPFALGATVSSGLTVSYASSNTSVATVSGSTVTIVGVGSTTITASQAGNASYNAATNVPQTLTVTSPDVSAPTVSSFSPANNSTDVAVDANLVATFSEPVALVNTKIIQIVRYPELTLHEQYTLPSANVQVSGSTLTINPTNNLLNSAAYYVYIGSDAITDAVGNPFAGIVSNGIWQFNTVSAGDVTPPAISSLSPADNATGVAVSSTLVVTFSENVVANSGIISIRQVADNSLHSSYNVNGGVTITDNTLTLVPSFDLDANTEYYIDLGAGIVKDAAGNLFAGLNGNPNWTFTTQQSVVSSINYTPNNGSSGISVAANLSITFSENINISTGTISFHYVSNGATITSLSNYDPGTMSITGSSITFDLPNDLPANTEVYVNVTSGYLRSAANSQKIWPGIQDNTSWRFTTGKINQTITFGALPVKTFGNAPFALSATSSSGLSVSYASSNTSVATVSGSTVTIVGVGSTTITASQAGNSTYHAASAVPQTLTVNKASQTITFAALPAKTFGDAAFSLGATASSGLAVSYASSNTAVATVSGNTVTIVGAGSTTITALQAGNTNYSAATDVPQTLTVNKASQTITFAALPAKTLGDAAFSLGATASSGLAVSYASSNAAVATVSGNTVTIVGAGSTTITASQAGNANYNAATSVPQTLTVNKASQTITFATLPAKTFGDAAFSLGATASSGLAVSYASSNAAVATVSGNTVTIVGAGSTTITASQAGNANYNAATSVPQTLTVNKASQTITFATLPVKTFGDAAFSLGATASSGLAVSYASSNAAVATVSGNTVTIVGAGSTTLTASQAGNANYSAATNVPQTLTVDKASQTITISPIADKPVSAAPFAVSASATSGLSLTYAITSGPATISGNTISLTGASGTVEVAVSQAGNANYNSATASTSFFVSDPAKTNQTITFAALPAKAYGDAGFTLGATASSGLTVAYTSSNLSVATVSGSSVTITGVGSATITASQAGNAAFNAAPTVQQTLTVSKGAQTLTFAAIADKTFGDAAFTLSPSASSSLSVSLEVVSGPVTLNGNQVTITGAGTATIRATQTGNENFNAATPVERSFTIAKKAQVITIGELADRLTTDPAFDVLTSVDSDLELSYSIVGPATLSGTTITLTGEEGMVTITVTQAGTANYLAAEASVSFEVTAPEVAEKQEQTITFAAIADKTFGDAVFALEATATSWLTVSFEVVSGPVTLNGNEVTITGAGTATIRATQAGDEAFNAAPPVERSFSIAKKAQLITIESIGDKLTTDGPFEVIASTNSGLALSYSVVGPATLSGSTLTLTGAEGTVNVTVTQAGNDNYRGAEATATFEVTAPVVKALSISGVASLDGLAFTQGQARLHPKNSNGSFAAPLTSALSANGAFTFADVPAGQYALSVASLTSDALTTYFEKATTLINAGLLTLSAESIEGVSIEMIKKPALSSGPGSIAGKLLLSGDGSRHLLTDGRTMEGTPLSGVTILLMTSPGGELVASAVTAADGGFAFTNLPLGAYKLLIDYEGSVNLESPEITITTGQLSFDVASEVTDEGIVIIAAPATTTGISAEALRSMVNAYPNPSGGLFTIAWSGALAEVKEIIVHNNNGSTVWQHPMTAEQLTVDISEQPAGVYFLRLVTSHGAAVHKLVIK